MTTISDVYMKWDSDHWKHMLLDMLTYLAYREAGKHNIYKRVAAQKEWWQFWKSKW